MDTYIRTYIHTNACRQLGAQITHAYIRTHIHTYMHAYLHTYIHTYIHTCIHTYNFVPNPRAIRNGTRPKTQVAPRREICYAHLNILIESDIDIDTHTYVHTDLWQLGAQTLVACFVFLGECTETFQYFCVPFLVPSPIGPAGHSRQLSARQFNTRKSNG